MARKEKLLKMLEMDPDDPFLHYALAQESLSSDDRDDAINRLRDVLSRFPEYHAAHFQLGQILAEDGAHKEAIEIIKSGIEVAQGAGDQHAVTEMTGFLQILGDENHD